MGGPPEGEVDAEGCTSMADWARHRKRRREDIKKENAARRVSPLTLCYISHQGNHHVPENILLQIEPLALIRGKDRYGHWYSSFWDWDWSIAVPSELLQGTRLQTSFLDLQRKFQWMHTKGASLVNF